MGEKNTRNEEIEQNEEIRIWLFAMVELSMEKLINQARMWEIWKEIEKNEFRENESRHS